MTLLDLSPILIGILISVVIVVVAEMRKRKKPTITIMQEKQSEPVDEALAYVIKSKTQQKGNN